MMLRRKRSIEKLVESSDVLIEAGYGIRRLLRRRRGASAWEIVAWLNDNGYLKDPDVEDSQLERFNTMNKNTRSDDQMSESSEQINGVSFKKRYGIIFEACQRSTSGYVDDDDNFHVTSDTTETWCERFESPGVDLTTYEEAKEYIGEDGLAEYDDPGRFRNPRIGYVYVSESHFEEDES